MFMSRPHEEKSADLLAITMGDACGIGPEIIAQWWPGGREAVVVGCPQVMARAVNWMPAGRRPRVRTLAALSEVATLAADEMGVWAPPGLPEDLLDAPLGQVDVRAGRAAAACIREAVRLAQTGDVAGIVTAPLHKEALALAGEPYPGHTELLQAEGSLPGQPPAPVRMMLANDQLKTVLVTIHVSLRQAIEQVSYESVLETLRITHRSAALWGQNQPRIAVLVSIRTPGRAACLAMKSCASSVRPLRRPDQRASTPSAPSHPTPCSCAPATPPPSTPVSSTWWWRCTTTRA